MTIEVLYFSLLRDISGCERESVALEGEGNVTGLIEHLYARYPPLADWDQSLLVAVNGEYATRATAISAGDEVALMPPVQGG